MSAPLELSFDEEGEEEDGRHQSPASYRQLLGSLRERVAGHEDALRQLALIFDSTWVAAQPNAVRERVLLIGPPGVGKSHLLHAIADALQVPCVMIDASAISESGWQGVQPADVMARVYQAVGRDISRIEAGRVLLVLDEWDKLATRNSDTLTTSVREGRQGSILGILGGLTPVPFTVVEPPDVSQSHLSVRTDRIPIICAGAFDGLVLRGGAPPDDDALRAYGFIPELVSRLTTRIVLCQRTPQQLIALWRSEVGVVSELSRACQAMGYQLEVTDGALAIAAHAVHRGAGGITARGGVALISSACRRALINALESDSRAEQRRIVVAPDDIAGSMLRAPVR